jgi:signal peptidase II
MVNLSGILLILYLFLTSDKRVRAGHIGMGLILAGALGNLVDRILPPHTVRDFIDFPFWPTFNPADVFLCVGVGLLALSILWGHKETSSTRLR